MDRGLRYKGTGPYPLMKPKSMANSDAVNEVKEKSVCKIGISFWRMTVYGHWRTCKYTGLFSRFVEGSFWFEML